MPNFTFALAIGIGGFVGALLRSLISDNIGRLTGPEFSFWGTVTVNLLGCFIIGIAWTLLTKTSYLSPVPQKFLVTGLLGSLTTFSTFALESFTLLQAGRTGAAVANISVNLVGGLLLVWLGIALTGAFVADSTTAA